MQILNPSALSHPFRCVLFDFNGTISLIRSGWERVMQDLYVAHIPISSNETHTSLAVLALNEIRSLTGKATIAQMQRLAEIISQRGGRARTPHEYKTEYLTRLNALICQRLEGLRTGRVSPSKYLVCGAERLLQRLSTCGIPMHLASGTDLGAVKEEARLLGVDKYFAGNIYGATDDDMFTKHDLMKCLVTPNQGNAAQILTFGDGPIDILHTKRIGGTAVAIASDEERNGQGLMNCDKAHLLTTCGADVLLPDFNDVDKILSEMLPHYRE